FRVGRSGSERSACAAEGVHSILYTVVSSVEQNREGASMIRRYGQGKYLHRAVEANGVLYLVGMTPGDKSADIKGQTRQVLEKMENLLEELGSSKSRVLSASVYLT